ncbi:MAG: sulfotransferase [Planctomycetes bacterium]|nr:sulfotransferase [Planctomycetota bacterium]
MLTDPGAPQQLKHRWSLEGNYLYGLTLRRWLRLLRENGFRVSPAYWHRAAFMTVLSAFNSWESWREDVEFGARVAEAELAGPPLFVLGHFRSGTTHLHNLLAKDPQFGTPSTYQACAPFTFLRTEEKATRRYGWMLPERRTSDNVAVSFEEPQEDELALSQLCGVSPYLGMSFPERAPHYERFFTFADANRRDVEAWEHTLLEFMRKLTVRHRKPLILKSPTHTARVARLVELFPEAKFVHIRRNPYDVFRSSVKFFDTTLWYVLLQRPRESQVEGVLRRYRMIYDAYLRERHTVPAGNLCEVRFEDLEAQPLETLERIYGELGLPGFGPFADAARSYLASLGEYKKNPKVPIDPALVEEIQRRWRPIFADFGYPLDDFR